MVSFCLSLLRRGSFILFSVVAFSAAAALSAKNRSNSLLDRDSSISPPILVPELPGFNLKKKI